MPSIQELRQLAQARLDDAELLFREGRYDAAADMCGYALEFGLKACICRRLRVPNYPDTRLKGAFKTHEFADMALLAGLEPGIEVGRNPALHSNWSIATGWKPEWRYRPAGSTDRQLAEAMLRALNDRKDGVLSWLKRHW